MYYLNVTIIFVIFFFLLIFTYRNGGDWSNGEKKGTNTTKRKRTLIHTCKHWLNNTNKYNHEWDFFFLSNFRIDFIIFLWKRHINIYSIRSDRFDVRNRSHKPDGLARYLIFITASKTVAAATAAAAGPVGFQTRERHRRHRRGSV